MLIDCHVHLNNYDDSHSRPADAVEGLRWRDPDERTDLYNMEERIREGLLQRVRDMISYMGDPGKQLMYGTDWPLAGMRTYRRFFDSLDLSADAKEGIASAAKLFRIDVEALAARRLEGYEAG